MSEPLPLFWVDLETTGLNIEEDFIIEIAYFMTDPQAKEVYSPEFWVCNPNMIEGYEEFDWYSQMVPIVQDMHNSSGLTELVRSSPIDEKTVMNDELPAYLEEMQEHYGVEKFTMAGSGVGPFDKPFILHNYPHLEKYFTYYVMDVGVVGRFMRNVCGLNLPDRPQVPHRAMDDLKEHHAELLSYEELVWNWIPNLE